MYEAELALDAGTPERDRHRTQRLAAVLGADPNLVPEDVDTLDAGDALQYRLGGIGVSVDDDGDDVGTDRSLELAGSALGDDPSRVDDADPVGKLVGFLQVLRGENKVRPNSRLSRRTSSQTRSRLGGSSPVVGSSRKSTDGLCISAAAGRVVGHAARIGRNQLIERPHLEDGRQLLDAVGDLGAVETEQSPWVARISRPVMFSSRPASWSATPIENRTSSASATTSSPPTQARPPVGSSRVVSIRTTVDFPAPLGPRKP